MTVYIIAQITIEDRVRYADYEAGFMDVFSRYSGKVLSVDEQVEVLEGEWPCTRTVIVEFPSRDDALAWYRSDDYQDLMQHRLAASVGNVSLVAGIPG